MVVLLRRIVERIPFVCMNVDDIERRGERGGLQEVRMLAHMNISYYHVIIWPRAESETLALASSASRVV